MRISAGQHPRSGPLPFNDSASVIFVRSCGPFGESRVAWSGYRGRASRPTLEDEPLLPVRRRKLLISI